MCDKFLMGCTLLTAFVHLGVLFSGILVHLVATLTGYVDIRSTQPSIPPGSVNEYQLRLGRQRQVWFSPSSDFGVLG